MTMSWGRDKSAQSVADAGQVSRATRLSPARPRLLSLRVDLASAYDKSRSFRRLCHAVEQLSAQI